MSKFLAKLMFQIQIEAEGSVSQFDEQIRIVEALDFEEATIKSHALGLEDECTFYNDRNNIVKWKFIEVFDLINLTEFSDGDQLYSRTHEQEQPEMFINYIKQTADLIKKKRVTFA